MSVCGIVRAWVYYGGGRTGRHRSVFFKRMLFMIFYVSKTKKFCRYPKNVYICIF